MERLQERIASPNQALAAFKKLVIIDDPSDIDSEI